MTSLIDCLSSVKVQSVLNKNTKEYGKKFLTDGNEDTCWQSDKSDNLSQTILLKFDSLVNVSSIILNFQGGFAAKEVILSSGDQSRQINPTDSNRTQKFEFSTLEKVENLKLVFKCYDLYGRLIIYNLDPLGESL